MLFEKKFEKIKIVSVDIFFVRYSDKKYDTFIMFYRVFVCLLRDTLVEMDLIQ